MPTVTWGPQQHPSGARGAARASWPQTEAHLGTRGAVLLTLGLAGLLIGLWVLTSHHRATPYSISSDARPRLPDGTVASDAGINVADAVARTCPSGRDPRLF